MQSHIIFYVTGIELQPYVTASAKASVSLQHQAGAFSCLSMKSPEVNYLDYMFVNTAFKSLHNASGSQRWRTEIVSGHCLQQQMPVQA